ncbi:hypothetical protein ABZP36_026794 [Zizania latifolia]
MILFLKTPSTIELGAWVGLCRQDDSLDHGQLCSCDVVSPEPQPDGVEPPWKLGKERLFGDDKSHAGAELVYMWDSRFCVLEFSSSSGHKRKRKQPDHRPTRRLLQLTAFGLKYGKHGELTTTMRRRSRSYAIPDAAAKFLAKPVAFRL